MSQLADLLDDLGCPEQAKAVRDLEGSLEYESQCNEYSRNREKFYREALLEAHDALPKGSARDKVEEALRRGHPLGEMSSPTVLR